MTNKLKYFIGNWKMFGDFSSLRIVSQINSFSKTFKKKSLKAKVILCVPNTLIYFLNSDVTDFKKPKNNLWRVSKSKKY